jgi:hypothetical protein
VTVHLGQRAAALVDGQLDHDARDWALAHLAHCVFCAIEVDAQRRLKARLAALSGPSLPCELADRLATIAVEPPPREHREPGLLSAVLPVAAFAPPSSGVSKAGGGGTRPAAFRLDRGGRAAPASGPGEAGWSGGRRPRRASPTRRVLLGSATLMLVAVGGAVAMGDGPGSGGGGPRVTPPVESFVAQHGQTAGGVPLTDPAMTAAIVSLRR